MTWFRVTIDAADERLRTYKVQAETRDEAEEMALAFLPLTAVALDDVDEFDEDEFDGILGDEDE